jgi:hypothetical protein
MCWYHCTSRSYNSQTWFKNEWDKCQIDTRSPNKRAKSSGKNLHLIAKTVPQIQQSIFRKYQLAQTKNGNK